MKAVTLYRPGTFGEGTFGSRVLENALSGFDHYMDSFFGDNFLSPSDRIFSRFPSVDVRENEKAYVIEADLPGFDEKDIEVRMDANNLTIESKKEEKNEESSSKEGGKYLIQERRVSSFCRTFRLPENANPEGITASFRNGILSLEVQKRAEAQTRVIQISKK